MRTNLKPIIKALYKGRHHQNPEIEWANRREIQTYIHAQRQLITYSNYKRYVETQEYQEARQMPPSSKRR